MPALGGYTTTVDANPGHLYRDVLVAIDAARFLNNGHPSSLAAWFDALDLQPADRVLHVGCGVGYYTAVVAETVGEQGYVTAVEIDAELAVVIAAATSGSHSLGVGAAPPNEALVNVEWQSDAAPQAAIDVYVLRRFFSSEISVLTPSLQVCDTPIIQSLRDFSGEEPRWFGLFEGSGRVCC